MCPVKEKQKPNSGRSLSARVGEFQFRPDSLPDSGPAVPSVVGVAHGWLMGLLRRDRGQATHFVAEEGWPTCSIASEVAAFVMEEGFDDLDAPVLRVANEDVPLPYAANLEVLSLPGVDKIIAAVKQVMA